MNPPGIVQAASPEDWRIARAMIEEYAASLGVDLCFQGFAEEMAIYRPGKGG